MISLNPLLGLQLRLFRRFLGMHVACWCEPVCLNLSSMNLRPPCKIWIAAFCFELGSRCALLALGCLESFISKPKGTCAASEETPLLRNFVTFTVPVQNLSFQCGCPWIYSSHFAKLKVAWLSFDKVSVEQLGCWMELGPPWCFHWPGCSPLHLFCSKADPAVSRKRDERIAGITYPADSCCSHVWMLLNGRNISSPCITWVVVCIYCLQKFSLMCTGQILN